MKRILIVGLTSLLAVSCGKKEEAAAESEAPRTVQVAEVEQGTIERLITVDGVLRAADQAAVTSKISAPVKRFLVNKGDHVKEGQLLAVLESADLAAAVADAKGAYDLAVSAHRTVSASSVVEEAGKAQSEVEATRQGLDAAQKLLDSRTQMYQQGALARRLVDEATVARAQAKSQFDIAQRHLDSFSSVARQESINSAVAQRESAKGKLDAAQAQLLYADIRSPIAGVVAERPAFAGEMASAGTPLITILDISRVIARVNVPQSEVGNIHVGQTARVAATDGSAKVDGKVTVVSSAVDPQSTTVEVWIEVPNAGERLRPGGTVHAEITATTVRNATLVPPTALYPSQEGGSAVVVVDAQSKAHQHKVTVGIRNADKVQILEGVNPGERVIVEGGLGLADDTDVKVESASDEDPGEAKDKDNDKNKSEPKAASKGNK